MIKIKKLINLNISEEKYIEVIDKISIKTNIPKYKNNFLSFNIFQKKLEILFNNNFNKLSLKIINKNESDIGIYNINNSELKDIILKNDIENLKYKQEYELIQNNCSKKIEQYEKIIKSLEIEIENIKDTYKINESHYQNQIHILTDKINDLQLSNIDLINKFTVYSNKNKQFLLNDINKTSIVEKRFNTKLEKLIDISNTKNVLMNYIDIHSLINIKLLNNKFKTVFNNDIDLIKIVYEKASNYKDKINKEALNQLNYFKNKSKKYNNNNHSKYLVYKWIFLQPSLENINEQTNNFIKILSNIGIIKNKINDNNIKEQNNVSFLSIIKNNIYQLGNNKIENKTVNNEKIQNSDFTENTKNLFNEYINVFNKLKIFDKEINFKNFCFEGINHDDINSFINKIDSDLQNKVQNFEKEIICSLIKIFTSCWIEFNVK